MLIIYFSKIKIPNAYRIIYTLVVVQWWYCATKNTPIMANKRKVPQEQHKYLK